MRDNRVPTPRNGIKLYEGRSVAAVDPIIADTVYEVAAAELPSEKRVLAMVRAAPGVKWAARYVVKHEIERIAKRMADESDDTAFYQVVGFPALCIARHLTPELRE
jgi:hypothetical protein